MKIYVMHQPVIASIRVSYNPYFLAKILFLCYGAQKFISAHPVNYFPRVLGKNIETCPPGKLFLFTSLYYILHHVLRLLQLKDEKNKTKQNKTKRCKKHFVNSRPVLLYCQATLCFVCLFVSFNKMHNVRIKMIQKHAIEKKDKFKHIIHSCKK